MRVAAELAQCISQSEAARRTGVALRTLQGWWAEQPGFRAYVRELQMEYAQGYNEQFAALIADALQVERLGLRGELPADDPRVQLAHDILSRTAYRIATIQAAGDSRANDRQPLPRREFINELKAPEPERARIP